MSIKKINEGCYLALHQTQKFKNVSLILNFFSPFSKEALTYGNLAADILANQCAAYPSKQAFNRHLDLLYGGGYGISNGIIGQSICLSFRIWVVNGRFVDQDLLNKQLDTLKDVVFQPQQKNAAFFKTQFLEAKENVLTNLLRDKDQPQNYAYKRALEIYGENYPIACDGNGDTKLIEASSAEAVFYWYYDMVERGYCELIAIGETEEELLRNFLKDISKQPRLSAGHSCYIKPFLQYQEVTEKAKIQQSQLLLVYQTPLNIRDADFYSLSVGCALLGQLPTSLLFQEVRERRSLCYYIASRTLPFDGGMLITTAMAADSIPQALTLIKELVAKVSNKDFPAELLSMAKELLVSNLKAGFDGMFGYVNESLRMMHIDEKLTTANVITKIESITIEEVASAFSGLKLETVYSYEQEN